MTGSEYEDDELHQSLVLCSITSSSMSQVITKDVPLLDNWIDCTDCLFSPLCFSFLMPR